MPAKANWAESVQPLLKKYNKKQHPLEYKNRYQLMVMVVLSAQTTDIVVNLIAPDLFKTFPDFQSMANVPPDALFPFIKKVRGFGKKAEWLIKIAEQLKNKKEIPLAMDDLISLPGIGRKSANVIRREAGEIAEGVIVDLHVVRVAPRLGIAKGDDPKEIEKQIMEAIPQKNWDAGMCMSFLGREICRPTDPKCTECVMNTVCKYYRSMKKK